MQTEGAFLIAGATGGIGAATARALHHDGFRVSLAGRNKAGLEALSKELDDAPSFCVEARDSETFDAAVTGTREAFGRFDGAVNCIGSFALKPIHLVTDEMFEHDLTLNLKSAFYLLRAAVKAMDKKAGGSVVLMSSAAARAGIPSHEGVAASKGGVSGLMLSAAATYASSNIRVNAVAPGLIETELTRSITGVEAVANASRSMHALGRFGQPDAVGRLVAFLLHPQNDFITGQHIGIDGGLATLLSKRG